jgi:hypothetical protein
MLQYAVTPGRSLWLTILDVRWQKAEEPILLSVNGKKT